MKIIKTSCNFERQLSKAPFGFKGGYLSDLWQSSVCMESYSGAKGICLGTQSTLWSDSSVFTSNSESAGNGMMFLITSYALKLIGNKNFSDPILFEEFFSEVRHRKISS